MAGFFSIDGKYYKLADRVGNLFWLNLLCLVCCIPVITVGPALTACYAVTLQIVRDEEGNVTRTFFRSFRRNFRQGVAIWLLFLLTFVILFAGTRLLLVTDETGSVLIPMAGGFRIVNGVLFLITAVMISYAFPLLARFENTVSGTLRNALIIGLHHLHGTLLLVLVNAAFPALLALALLKEEAVWLLSVFLCFGISAPAYACSLVLYPVFQRYMPRVRTPEARHEEDSAE